MTRRLLCVLLGLVTTVLAISVGYGDEGGSLVAYRALDLNDSSSTRRLTPSGTRGYESGYEESDGVYICDAGSESNGRFGYVQTYQLNQTKPTPLIAEGWSKGENVDGNKDMNYSLYVDLIYDDDTPLWGQTYEFPVGDSDWTRGKVVIFPDKPIKFVTFYAMFRNHSGKAYFKELALYQYELENQAIMFNGVPIEIKSEPKGESRAYLRDVKGKGDFLAQRLDGEPGYCKELGITIQRKDVEVANGTEISLRLKNETTEDKALQLVYAIPFPETPEATAWRWYDGPRQYRELGASELSTTRSLHDVGSGRTSYYPIGAIAGLNEQGEIVTSFGLGIDPDFPAFYRIASNGSTRELYIAYDLALTQEKPELELRILPIYWEISEDGLSVKATKRQSRGALPLGTTPFRACFDVYRQAFPERFKVRALRQGNWMAFAKVSKVAKWEDFGFQFKEGIDETAEDDARGISTFRYTEPMTWWQQVPKSDHSPKTKEAAWSLVLEGARKGNAEARSLLTTGFTDREGRPFGMVLDTPWCDGVVWSVNDAPYLVELTSGDQLVDATNKDVDRIAGFAVKWNEEIADKLYDKRLPENRLPRTREELLEAQTLAGGDGEYIDSSEGYVTATLDFSREHFSGMRTPLVYDAEQKRPAIFRGLIAYEYARKIAEDCHARGKLAMANATPSLHFWLTPQLDVLGTETNWNHSGGWRPMPDEELMYRRVLCCGKPYCFLMNTDFSQFTRELSERYMKRALMYGMFPSFFSADASTAHYFDQPKLYERDRELFKKYVPIVKEVAESGWEPETGAETNDTSIYVERFGSLKDAYVSSNPNRPTDAVYLTIFNDSEEAKDYALTLGESILEHITKTGSKVVELTEGQEFELVEGKLLGTIPSQDVRVFKIAR